MTTTVTVEAHCSPDKQVRVTKRNRITGEAKPDFTLQDGEKNSDVVYDDWVIEVREEFK